MFQKINDRINSSYATEVSRRTEDILTLIHEKIKNYKRYASLTEAHIDFNEFEITGDKIEILRTPKIYWPFRSHGKIKFNLIRTEKEDLTKIKCEILPGDNSIPYILTFEIIAFVLWTILFLYIGQRLDWTTKIVVSILVFGVPTAIIYFNYRIAKYALTDYSKAVIKLMSE
jgi:hypothetical protein